MSRFQPIFAWYDFWVGIFVDTKQRLIYFFPIPMFGLRVSYCRHVMRDGPRCEDTMICKKCGYDSWK